MTIPQARSVSDAPQLHDRSIGDIIRDTRNLSAEQVQAIVDHQKSHGVRFGEAAVALGFASTDDVLFALAQQFHYPYAAEDQREASPELVTLNQPFSHEAEAFRAIRSQVAMKLFAEDGPRPALAVVSPQRGDGKTYFAANLAVTLAQLGGRTLLIDADMRHPRQHEVFKVAHDAGLSGILAGRSETRVIQAFRPVPGLFILPVGIVPPNPAELVERQAFGLLLKELSTKFDRVLIDTPAVSEGTDGLVIAARAGVALMVGRQDATRLQSMRELADDLAGGSTQLAGVIVNEF
jgi:chain length determinant protein tyrosine kinase EpsG